MPNDEFLKWTTSEVDFYELLGLTFEQCSESELRRAYRKTALKYHPDKVGKDFDPDKYELFQAANEVLSDPELKAKYDNHRNAKLLRQRANDLFEGKRRQMKEDLEAAERGGAAAGVKRSREEDSQDQEFRRLAEEDFKVDVPSSPAPSEAKKAPEDIPIKKVDPEPEDGREAELERRIQEAREAKAKRKADKKARKSGIFIPLDSPAVSSGVKAKSKWEDQDMATPIKRPDVFKGLKADEKSSASPKFSFSPSTPKNDFAATMARLKAAEAERKMQEEEIRRQESQTTA
ncbi:putative Pre-mRNA-splicing factor cwc23 [Glarea lozoyensis 74030]|uniref:Putative Pre-mRNA-splicing factor cwc23 n=1 Tax=Glarea lozoyensis (strain ATCC 74030 / MF5533) TaxID=1104152 RepID=H0EPU2_GLAL7|nr:putative Pre-mRNA-splicing factor cwc23 [Glarea lozoyensis 74030]